MVRRTTIRKRMRANLRQIKQQLRDAPFAKRRRNFRASGGIAACNLTTQADSDNSICFGGRLWGSYLRRKDRANSFANRESSSVLIITHASKHNEVSESGLITTPSLLKPTAVGLVRMATPTC